MAKKKASKRPAAKDKDESQAFATRLKTLLEKPGNDQKVLDLLLPLEEDQLRELSPLCQKWYRKVKKNEWVEDSPGTWAGNVLMPATMIAIYCTGNLTEIKKLGWRMPDGNVVLEILIARRPTWIASFVKMLLDRKSYWNNWRLCRELVRQGLVSKPDNPRYYTGMITGLIGRWNRGERTALDELRKDPELLKDDIWRLFEYEGELDNTLANVDRWEDSNWSGALVALSKEGKLSREKLLDAALGALELGFNHYRARWFFNFFDRMEPADNEFKKRASRILDLIGSPTPNVAQWAFEKQKLLIDRGLLKITPEVIHANVPLMGGRHKKTVLQTLALFDQIASTTNESAEVCLMAVEALSHEKPDVQKAAFKLVEKHGSPDNRELQKAVEKFASVAAATVKKRIQSWLGSGTVEKPAKNTPKKSLQNNSTIDSEVLNNFDPGLVELLSLSALENSPNATTPIPAAIFDGTDFPRLDPDRRITQIEDLDELLETLGRVIEDDNLVDDAERAIDGLARLHADEPNDFDKRIGPLFKRACNLIERKWAPFAGQGVGGELCGLIVAWKRGEPVTIEVKKNQWGNENIFINGLFDKPVSTWHLDGVPLAFMSRRMLDVCGMMTSRQPRQLLSSPTHEGGWIDPAVLVVRINGLKVEPPESDVVLALLRLAPDGRAAALKKLKPSLKGEWINAVKHGLGAGRIRIGKTPAFWAAAARCRSPLEDDPKVTRAFPTLGPGAGKAARFETRFKQEKTKYGPSRDMEISTTENPPKKVRNGIPSQLFQRNRHDGTSLSFHDIGTTAGSIRWLATLWPAAFESFFATGAGCLGDNLDWWEAQWHNRCFLEPLIDPDIPLLDMGELLLLCGLGAKEPGEHGLAVDIAIQAINDGRLGTDNMGRLLTTGVTSGHFNLPRLAKRLHDIANASDLHAYVVMHSAESALPNIDASQLPRGIGDVFELLAEIGTQLERGIENQASRTILETITGSNKAAKTARHLLKIDTCLDPREIIATAMEQRIDRLQEWAKR